MTHLETMQGVVVISGASRGLGLAVARHLLDRGRAVAGFARIRTAGVEELERLHQGRFRFECVDVLSASDVDAFLDRSTPDGSFVAALINNAAIGQDQMLAHLAPASIDSLLAVNLQAPILLTRSVVRRMLVGSRPGRIVNVTSICGSRGFAGLTVYSAAKAGLEGFTRSLARELGPRGILVNAIAPGFFASEMSHVLSSEQTETIRRRTPTERLITPQDVLPLFDLLLHSDCNLTGQVLRVDGGITA